MAQYAWEDYKVLMGGRFVTGIRGFKYKKSQEKEAIYAEGSEPHSMGRGNKKYTCEMDVLQSELEAIILSGGGDITSIEPFTVVHSYQPKAGLPIITDVIEDVEFTEVEKAMKQGAMFMECALPMVCMRIKYNVAALPNQN
jgi:hypothetical protein